MSYEVSDEYFTDNKTPYRASNLLKSAKILIILEDPVKRAFYHYQVLVLCTKNFLNLAMKTLCLVIRKI